MPPIVEYDYNKCSGSGSCAEVCPVSILEVTKDGRWCKAIDEKVENKEAVEEFHAKVESSKEQVNVIIRNVMPECILCRACEAACPVGAIHIYEE